MTTRMKNWTRRSAVLLGLGRDLCARGIGGVGHIQFGFHDESSFKKDGKNILSINPCGSLDCKVCQDAEIFPGDVELYNFDF
jgi:hypothetical protein